MKLQYAFKTPTLRDVTRRGPYMHDGSLPTLADVIDLYNRGGIDRPSRDDEIRRLKLAQSEKSDLIAFLQTLSGEPKDVAVSYAAALTPGVCNRSDHRRQRAAYEGKAAEQQGAGRGLDGFDMGWEARSEKGDNGAACHRNQTRHGGHRPSPANERTRCGS